MIGFIEEIVEFCEVLDFGDGSWHVGYSDWVSGVAYGRSVSSEEGGIKAAKPLVCVFSEIPLVKHWYVVADQRWEIVSSSIFQGFDDDPSFPQPSYCQVIYLAPGSFQNPGQFCWNTCDPSIDKFETVKRVLPHLSYHLLNSLL